MNMRIKNTLHNQKNIISKNKEIRIALYYLLLILVLLSTACQVSEPVDKILEKFHDATSEYVMVTAHRARTGNQDYPENSISAIKHAIDVGVDIIELDVKVTLDNVVILNHDQTIDRTTTGKGNPEEYTWEELQQFRLKLSDGTVTNEKIATFEEALKLAKGKVMIDIDLKTSNLKSVVDVVKKTNTIKQVLFFDSSFEILNEVISLCPESIVMPRARSYETADLALHLFETPVIHIDDSFYTEKLTKLIRNRNARVWINALGKGDEKIRNNQIEELIKNLLRFKANIIQTDELEILIPYLESKGLR